jgi:hypothetical protein
MPSPQDFKDFLLTRGDEIRIPGSSDVGLKQVDALQAVQLLREGSVAVLGGDVYTRAGDRDEPAYANWACDRLASETTGDYTKRSLDRAESYIRAYPATPDTLFVFVVARSSMK